MDLIEYKIKYQQFKIRGDLVTFDSVYKLICHVGYDNLDDIELRFYKGKNQETMNDNYYDDCKTFFIYSNYKYFNNELTINNIQYFYPKGFNKINIYDNEIHIINKITKEVGVIIYGSLYLCETGENGDGSSLNLGGFKSYIFLNKNKLKELGLLDCNSTMENRIYHMYYENTIENDIVKRFQRKLAESNTINGIFDVALEKRRDKNS